MLRNTGWKNFGCDLIIGLPWQTLASFKKDLHTLVKFHPSHFSTYFLSYDTPKIDSFNKDIPGEEEQIAMYTYADRYLSQKGYLHYEVSNFALPGFECQHNQKYWNRQEYLGLGLGAHSFINEEITENQDKFEPYLSDPLSPKEQFRLEKDLIEADSIMLNLRKSSGIDLNQFSKNFGHVDTQQLLRKAGPLIGSKHLRFFQNNICPTLTGWLILDKITRDLI
jgi:oxygen-independent coproporphyrinogen-3 oxidase